MSTPAIPIVSVLMTAYNRETFLAEAIESVLGSTFRDFELIVVDDGSFDRSFEIARSYAAKDSRIRAFRNERNVGDYLNRNKAASFALGTYVKYLDSDDLIYPWGLGAMVDCMTRFPKAGLGLSAAAEAHCPHPRLLSPREAYLEHFTRTDLLGRAPGSAIIRREAFEALGGFTGLRQVGDFELWLNMVARYPLVTLPRDLVWDRTHGQQEQFADGDIEKLGMRHKLAVAALQSALCPLSEEERLLARACMRRAYRKEFWIRLLIQRQLSAALKLRRVVDLPLGSLAA
jgi:glycosyltransferase involved in cell wall biosynthesis